MKGILILELFGEDTRQLCKICRKMFEAGGGDAGAAIFDAEIGVPPRSSWVAEVTGPDEKYGLARTFLRGKMDYSKANSKGSRGIFVEYVLDPGKIYEVKSQETWRRAWLYFCTVDGENGNIVVLEREEIYHRFGALTPEEAEKRRMTQIAEITGPSEQYFFSRIFLNCDVTYSDAEEHDPYPGYTLQAGKVYEITERLSRGRRNRYYCIMDAEGGLVRLDEDGACRAIGVPTRKERWEKRAEKLPGDQRTGSCQTADQQGV